MNTYRIEPWGDGWALTNDGSNLQIGGHGGVAPSVWDALREAFERARDDEAAGYPTTVEVEPLSATWR